MAKDIHSESDSLMVNTPSGSLETTVINQKSYDSISRNIFVELGGPSLGIGIGYDQRFKPASIFGFSAGLAFTNGSVDNSGGIGAFDSHTYTRVDFKGLTIPLEINAIMGKWASKFELGVGATPCIFHREEIGHMKLYGNKTVTYVKEGAAINIFGTLNIGYRLQRKSGFFLKAALTFLIGDIQCSPIDGLYLAPNICLGYTIK